MHRSSPNDHTYFWTDGWLVCSVNNPLRNRWKAPKSMRTIRIWSLEQLEQLAESAFLWFTEETHCEHLENLRERGDSNRETFADTHASHIRYFSPKNLHATRSPAEHTLTSCTSAKPWKKRNARETIAHRRIVSTFSIYHRQDRQLAPKSLQSFRGKLFSENSSLRTLHWKRCPKLGDQLANERCNNNNKTFRTVLILEHFVMA